MISSRFRVGRGPIQWAFAIGGKRNEILVKPRLRTTSFEVAVRAAVAGLGIVFAPDTFVRDHLRHHRLAPVLASSTLPGAHVHAVTPPGGMVMPKMRAFVETLRAAFPSSAIGGPHGGRP